MVGLLASLGLIIGGLAVTATSASAATISTQDSQGSDGHQSEDSNKDNNKDNNDNHGCKSGESFKASSNKCEGDDNNNDNHGCKSGESFKASSNKCEGDDNNGDHNCSSGTSYNASSNKCEDDNKGDHCESNGSMESSNARTDCNPCDTEISSQGGSREGCNPNPCDIRSSNYSHDKCECPSGTESIHNECVPTCPEGVTRGEDGQCQPVVPPVDPPTVTSVPGGPTPVEDVCPNLPGDQWYGYDCNTGLKSTATEAAAVVAVPVTAPQAATVSAKKPVKKPVKKPAAAHVPNAVDAGVATLPTSANVPSAVNAGGGSSAPTTPLMGWALLAMGLLGAAGATTLMVAGRKE